MKITTAAMTAAFLASTTLAQEPNIDSLLAKLPKAESFERPKVDQVTRDVQSMKNDPTARAILAALQRGDKAAALRAAQTLGLKFPQNAAAHLAEGVMGLVCRQAEVANSAFRRAVALNPNFADAYYGLAASLALRGQFANAMTPLRRGALLEPNNPAFPLALSLCAQKLGHREERVAFARQATQIAPSNLVAWVDLARAENGIKQPVAAMQALSRAAELAPDIPSIQLALGLGFINLKEDTKAIPHLQWLAQRQPDLFIVHAQLGYCYLKQGQTNAAVDSLRRATSLAPKYGPAWNHLGLAYERQGKNGDALKAFQRATELMPTSRSAWEKYSAELREVGKIDDANKAAARAATLKPAGRAAP